MSTSEYLKILDAPCGVSGHEKDIRNCVKDLFSKYCSKVYTDTLGNVIGIRKGTDENAPSLMVEAHMDELGLMVSSVTDEGSLRFVTVGGFDPKILPGTEVTVHGREKLFGVIGATPPHLTTDRSKAPSLSELCIDIGFSKEETEKRVTVGDIITMNASYTPLSGSMVAARCIDDRGGLAIIMQLLENLGNENLQGDIIVVATVQEEVGLRGARVAANALVPDCAIALDVCHAESPGVSDDAFPAAKGPVITIGPNLHRKMTRAIIDEAKKTDIDFQLEVCSGDTGTDAWEIQVAQCGVPTALISVPIRYMHTNYEVCDSADMDKAAQIITEFARALKGGECLCF